MRAYQRVRMQRQAGQMHAVRVVAAHMLDVQPEGPVSAGGQLGNLKPSPGFYVEPWRSKRYPCCITHWQSSSRHATQLPA